MPANPRDVATANRSAAQKLPSTVPTSRQGCPKAVKQLRAGVFFDGTNNNRFRDMAVGKDTNVSRLFDMYREFDDSTHRKKQYIVGIGSLDEEQLTEDLDQEVQEQTEAADGFFTKAFVQVKATASAKATYWATQVGDLAGKAGGLGGQARLNDAYAWLRARCAEVPPEAPKTVDVYGFSRGAALARTFVNLVNQALKPSDSSVEVRFVGIFDTVGSFGIAGDDSDPGQNMAIDGGAASIFHCCAQNEYRSNFPLVSAPGSDRWYIGAHSDVGGGYGPNEDGKVNHLAFIPLADTHEASVGAGVELSGWQPVAQKAGVDVDGLRALAKKYDPNDTAPFDPKSDYAAQRQAFMDKYVHISASSRWNKLAPNHAEWSGLRTVYTPSSKTIVGAPPDFDWE
jgi:hypothetical protein